VKYRRVRRASFEFLPKLRESVNVKSKRIRLFIKPYCPWCHRAERWLKEQGIGYEAIDVISDEAAYDEMIRLSGQDLAPVIEVEGEILADFGPEELAAFWKRLESQHAGADAR